MFHYGSALRASLKISGIMLGASLTLLGLARAQEADSVATQAPEAPTTGQSQAQAAAGPIEQVIVTGQRSLGSLIREGAELTEAFYERLNIVLDNEDYRINCQNEFPTGSRISTRVCRTRFQEELLNRQAVSIIRGLDNTEDGPELRGTLVDVEPELRRRMMEFEEDMLQAVNTDSELNQQVIRLIALKSAVENYETPREQRRQTREAERAAEGDD